MYSPYYYFYYYFTGYYCESNGFDDCYFPYLRLDGFGRIGNLDGWVIMPAAMNYKDFVEWDIMLLVIDCARLGRSGSNYLAVNFVVCR